MQLERCAGRRTGPGQILDGYQRPVDWNRNLANQQRHRYGHDSYASYLTATIWPMGNVDGSLRGQHAGRPSARSGHWDLRSRGEAIPLRPIERLNPGCKLWGTCRTLRPAGVRVSGNVTGG